MAQNVIIDVGSNRGEFAIDVALLNPSLQVLAIEPIPHLGDHILENCRKKGVSNIKLLRVAVDVTSRSATLNVAARGDFGVSSLLSLNHDSIRSDEYWGKRTDLHFDSSITVPVIRLDSVDEIQTAPRIAFIKIDAQGLDIPALESLGTLLPRVEAGMLEVPATLDSKLYTEETYDLLGSLNRLRDLGFQMYGVKPNDHASREFNVFFCREGLDWREMEQRLKLRGIPLYDGKHFWHSPADRLLPEGQMVPHDSHLGRFVRLVQRLDRLRKRLVP